MSASVIHEGFRLLDDINVTMAPGYSAIAVAELGESLATDIGLLSYDLLIRHQAFSEAAPLRPTLAIWVETVDGTAQGKLAFGDRTRVDWAEVVPSDAILVPFDEGRDVDGVPIDEPTLQQIGYCLNEEQWQVGFRSPGFLRSLIMLAENRGGKVGVAA